MWPLSKSKVRMSSRLQIKIKEVKDGVLVLPNNNFRVIVETSSVNFELKSDEEQDVIIDSFQNFLNSLPCPLQILIRVREIDIDSYVERISESKEQEPEEIYKSQIEDYCAFVKTLVSGNKILSRRFYVVIPYQNGHGQTDFKFIKEQLFLRRDIVMRGLEKLGMKARIIDSIEILELFYNFYNPSQVKTQELKSSTIQMLLQHTYD